MNEKTLMPFGKHQGEYLEDLPIGYVKWLLNQDWIESKSIYRELDRILNDANLKEDIEYDKERKKYEQDNL